VRAPSAEEATPIAHLFESYASDLLLRDKFNLPEYMGDDLTRDLHVLGALIETTDSSYGYSTDLKVMQRPNLPPGVQVQVPQGQPIPLVPWVSRAYEHGIVRMGWQENRAGE
jgi:hypothetical protein